MTGITHWALRHKRLVIGFWLILTLLGMGFAKKATSALSQEYSLPGHQSYVTNTYISSKYGGGGDSSPLVAVVGGALTWVVAASSAKRAAARAKNATPFEAAVWHQLCVIPRGSTRSYGAIAERLGDPHASRAVGHANGANPLAIVIPCHRAIGADGSLTGYRWGIEVKRRLLEHERALIQSTFALPIKN